ncbi:YfiT family bacillithiol transferase [Xanthocytophaga agilis]|uniref:Metal-dependent hydrolase n=1 Tax=Xanthocytophaga agilis TaxID=3048010 RepID=A0AAE3R362_9BACT|nr:putative metal-dependent hydrolase [Xanthocytophaga agilis]MDJ1500794.1 putative metal-dependent hydrolase [Xanthocytophaga agilis]
MDLEKLKYPIGKFDHFKSVSFTDVPEGIQIIESFPVKLSELVNKLTPEQLQTPYRPDGWTALQVVHHLADSHSNALIRFKLALTEENPVIKPYHENLWAELEDGKTTPVEVSLQWISALHKRWAILLRSMTESDFERTYFHPESKRTYPLKQVVSLYVWHCNHHYGHIESVLK